MLTNKRILVAVLSVILVLLGVGSWFFLDFGVSSILTYKSPYTFQVHPGSGSQQLAQRLILIIADGVEWGSAENMLSVRDMANRGVAVSLQGNRGLAPIPASTVLMTGALPEISGVITNWFNDTVAIDSLWSSASRAGLSTAIVGDAKWEPLFGDSVTQDVYHVADGKSSNTEINDAILEDAIIEIRQGKSRLMLVNFLPERRFAHSMSETGRQDITREEAEANIDARLVKLLETVDLSSSAVMVVLGSSLVAHHVAFDSSKTGGNALLVAAGAGIMTPEDPPETIQWIPGHPADIAPTCASLLGISIPTHSQGKVLFSVLDMPYHALSEIAIRQTAARAGFAAEYIKVTGKQCNEDWSLLDAFLLHNDGNYQDAYDVALSIDENIVSLLKRTRSGLIASSRLISIPVFVLVASLFVCIMTVILQGNLDRVPISVLGVLSYFSVYYGLLLGRAAPLSASAVLRHSELTGFYHGRLVDSVASLVIIAVITGWLAARVSKDRKGGQGLFAGLISCSFIALILMGQICVFVMSEGFAYTLYTPDMQKGFRCFVYLIQLMATGILSPILAGLSEGVFAMAQQVRLHRSGQRERLNE